MPATFQNHLDGIRRSKRNADSVLETLSPGHNAAEASIALAWELVFDHFCTTPQGEHTLSDLNTISAIIHKLITSNTQIKTLEHKIQDQQYKLEERQRAAQALKDQIEKERRSSEAGGLTPETLARIEAQLNLL